MVEIFMCISCKDQLCDKSETIEIYEEFRKYLDLIGEVDITATQCIGEDCCGGPTVRVQDKYFRNITVKDVESIVYSSLKENRKTGDKSLN